MIKENSKHATLNFNLPLAECEDEEEEEQDTGGEYLPNSDDSMGAEVSLYSICQRLLKLFRRAFSRRQENQGDDLEVTFVRSKPDRIDALCKTTKFTKSELKLIYQGFKQACPTGVVNESTFKDVYAQFFPQGDASQYAHYVFKAFDHDRSGTINFQEFVIGLSTISRGSPREKLQWTFNLYDLNGDGCITREEMHEVINSIYSLLGRFTEPVVSEEATRDHADRVFDRLDQNKDGIVTFDEFLEICLQLVFLKDGGREARRIQDAFQMLQNNDGIYRPR